MWLASITASASFTTRARQRTANERMKRSLTLIATALTLLTTPSCVQNDVTTTLTGGYMFRPSRIRIDPGKAVSYGYWDMPAGLEGDKVIVIDTALQQAKYYVGNRQVGMSAISSGKAGHITPKGTFKVLSKDADHRSSSYGSIVDAYGNVLISNYEQGMTIPEGGIYEGAPMTNGMQLTTNGIWMHEGMVTSAPESHGCIRLPAEMAKIFFDNTPVGTPVIIK